MTSTRLAIADLRDSWSAWLAVSLTFLVTSAAIGLSALVLNTSTTSSAIHEDYQIILAFEGYANIFFCSIVALVVVSSSTSLVIGSRRGAIARLLLAGATPGQVVRMLVVQLGLVTLACSVIGNAVAVASQTAVLRVLAADRGFDAPEAAVSHSLLLASSVYCAAVAMVGGAVEARRATMIPPVEALRVSCGMGLAVSTRRRVVLQWTGFAACCLAILVVVLAFPRVAPELGVDGFDTIFQIAMATMVLMGLGLCLIAGFVVGPLTRLWTRMVPIPGPSWNLARHMVMVRADRLVKSVVPALVCVGLVFGTMSMVDSINATLRVNNFGYQLDGASIISLFGILGLSIAVALAGSVGNLVMMTRQRDAELALDSIVGATPRQQVALPALEATMVTVTAGLLGLMMAGASIGVLAYGMPYVLDVSEISIPCMTLLGILLAMWVIVLAATVLPSLPSLRRPAPRVIARLVAS